MRATRSIPRELITQYVIWRFWEKVEKLPDMGEQLGPCWRWCGAMFTNGYGQFFLGGAPHGAHRVAYAIEHGTVPPRLDVMHQCDHKWCVRPSHLVMGTNAANQKDKVTKRRQARGERNGRAVLTAQQVLDIRRRHAEGESYRALSKAFGVGHNTVADIVRGNTWRS